MNSLAYDMHLMTNSGNIDRSASSYLSSGEQDTKAIKTAALRLLARREYSRLELYRRLSQRFSNIEVIQDVLANLSDEGYQSDARFAESFIRSKVSAGNGPFKIKIALREKGICESTALSAFDRLNIDWIEVIDRVFAKRFGVNDSFQAGNQHERQQALAKQVRYLKNKGFYQEHIEAVIDPS